MIFKTQLDVTFYETYLWKKRTILKSSENLFALHFVLVK